MNALINMLEKQKPLFEKISRNIYLRAICDGFIASMPVTLLSSIFLLIAFVLNIFGFTWSDEIVGMLMKPYGHTMGVVALLVANTTVKSLKDSVNRNLESTNQINYISMMLASVTDFLSLASDPIGGGFASGFLGTKGLLSAFLGAFITVNIYKVCVKNNVTIRMPAEVLPNISQVFKDLFLLARHIIGTSVAEAIDTLLAPLFTATDCYLGITIIFGVYALFWFVGIHGPSIVEPGIAAITYANIETNLQLFQAGQHADKVLT